MFTETNLNANGVKQVYQASCAGLPDQQSAIRTGVMKQTLLGWPLTVLALVPLVWIKVCMLDFPKTVSLLLCKKIIKMAGHFLGCF